MTPTNFTLPRALLLALLLLAFVFPAFGQNKLSDWRLTARPKLDQFPAGHRPEIQVTITNAGRQKATIQDFGSLWVELDITVQRDGVSIPVRKFNPLVTGGISSKTSFLAPGVGLTRTLDLGAIADCSLPGKYLVTGRRMIPLFLPDGALAKSPPLGPYSATAHFEVLPSVAPLTQTASQNGLKLTATLSTAVLKSGNPLLVATTLEPTGRKAKPLEMTAGFFNEYEMEVSRNGLLLRPIAAMAAFEAQTDRSPVTTPPGTPDSRSLEISTFYDCRPAGDYGVVLRRRASNSSRNADPNAHTPLEVLLGFQVPAP